MFLRAWQFHLVRLDAFVGLFCGSDGFGWSIIVCEVMASSTFCEMAAVDDVFEGDLFYAVFSQRVLDGIWNRIVSVPENVPIHFLF